MSVTVALTTVEISALESRPGELSEKPQIKANGSDIKPVVVNAVETPQNGEAPSESPMVGSTESISKWKATVIISTGARISFVNTLLGGVLIGYPEISSWPASVNTLASGCTLLLLGSTADIVGIALKNTSLGIFSYVFSFLASDSSNFLASTSLALFPVAVVLIPIFSFDIHHQERLGRKAILPSSIWENRIFTCLCITVFLMWGVFESIQFFLTLFFQDVQGLSTIQTSLRFLPMVLAGTLTNVLTGWLVQRVRADIFVLGSAVISSITPLSMAIINLALSFGTCAFFASACAPICADVLFTVANLLITMVFPPETHGLAGGVFNTIANIGNSIGLAITAVVAASVTLGKKDGIDVQRLMDRYRATFWLCFGADIFIIGVVVLGLRKIGKIGKVGIKISSALLVIVK